jgi:hypothetical protein
MEKILYAWRIQLGRASQSFAISVPLIFLPYESKEALTKVQNKRDITISGKRDIMLRPVCWAIDFWHHIGSPSVCSSC